MCRRTVARSLIISLIMCVIGRSCDETDMIAPFVVGSFLLFCAAATGLQPPGVGRPV
jgi:hypothetical protein